MVTMMVLMVFAGFSSCRPKTATSAFSEDAAIKTYVAPGEYDEFYNFVSGGFSGQLSIYGLPSGRLLKVIPVFSVNAENGWGFSEETKPMLNTSFGPIPWDDSHHPNLSMTDGEYDGRWVFINGNNTPRIARIDLETFKTVEIIELPNTGGNHPSAYVTENTEYVVAGTRFSIPPDYVDGDVSINSYKENFKGHISFVSVDQETGQMELAFQLAVPPFNYDLSHPGKGKSHGWFFFTCYNSEQAHSHLEVNASQNDKDFVLAVNWKKIEEHIKAGKGQEVAYAYNKGILRDLLRDSLGFTGIINSDTGPIDSMPWGVEDLTVEERYVKPYGESNTGPGEVYTGPSREEISFVDSPDEADYILLWLTPAMRPLFPANSSPLSVLLSECAVDIDYIHQLASNKPVILAINFSNPFVIDEIYNKQTEEQYPAILATFGVSMDALLDVVTGKFNPSGKLPITLPASMKAVENNREDVPGYLEPEGYALFKYGHGLSY